MSQNLLEIAELGVRFAAMARPAVAGVSLVLAAGEKLALVGESGSGKSVTARAILRLDGSASYSGAIRFAGDDLLTAPEPRLRALRGGRIAMIFQEPMTALNPLYTIGDQIDEVLRLHCGLDRRVARRETISLLEQVGIDDPACRAQSFVHQLSGGQRQRAMIAMALAGEPELLIADEPTTALDATVQAEVLELLASLVEQLGTTLIFISHDLPVIAKVADDLIVMRHGEVVEQTTVALGLSAPEQDYTKHLIQSAVEVNYIPGRSARRGLGDEDGSAGAGDPAGAGAGVTSDRTGGSARGRGVDVVVDEKTVGSEGASDE